MGVKTETASKLDRSIWTKASGKGFQHQFTSKYVFSSDYSMQDGNYAICVLFL